MKVFVGKFSKKYSKFFFPETVRRMKLKRGILAKDIDLYKNYDFYSGWIRTLVAMATYSFHRLIMGKVEIGNSTVSLGILEFYFYRNVY